MLPLHHQGSFLVTWNKSLCVSPVKTLLAFYHVTVIFVAMGLNSAHGKCGVN